jgi:CheY-like chemotaxis protein
MQLCSIAYVDDEPDLREVVQLALSLTTGATVQCYESGAQALERLPALRPDLVLLDVMMPGMDGTEVIQRMQADGVLKNVPVIFMTAKAMPDELARLRSLCDWRDCQAIRSDATGKGSSRALGNRDDSPGRRRNSDHEPRELARCAFRPSHAGGVARHA